jgi:hypothetical protein
MVCTILLYELCRNIHCRLQMKMCNTRLLGCEAVRACDCVPTVQHSITSLKTVFIVTGMRTSKLTLRTIFKTRCRGHSLTRELWVGMANRGPPSPTSQHHTAVCGLAGEGGHTLGDAFPELMSRTCNLSL